MAMRGTYFSTGLIAFLFVSFAALASCQDILQRGSSISIKDGTTTILVSPSGAFSCGFYKVATNAFTFSIWFTWSSEKTVAWTANRDTPVNGNGSRIVFQKDGSLNLLDYNDTAIWSSNTAAMHAVSASLLNNGSLVIMDPDGHHLWKSFDSPTDTLLPLQSMTTSTKLVSASAKGLLSSGFYTFYFDNNNKLSLLYRRSEISSVYWPGNAKISYNSSQYGFFDPNGTFIASDQLRFSASDLGDNIMPMLTLDYDGNLRLYSLNVTSGNWSISGMLFVQICEIPGLCGVNSLCEYRPNLRCSCLEGFEMIEISDWSKGCTRSRNSVANEDLLFIKLPGTDFWGYEFGNASQVPLQKCLEMCLDSSDCQAFRYRGVTGQCYLKTLIFSGKEYPEPYCDIYLKVPKGVSLSSRLPSIQIPACKVTEIEVPLSIAPSRKIFKFGYFLSSALTLLVVEVILILFGFWAVHRWKRRPENTDEGNMIIFSQFCRFSYKELQKATNCFREELGSGGSGVVYKGVLADERKVAVKKLSDMIQGEQEFRSELSVIVRIYHMNVARIWGFCAEKTQRLLFQSLFIMVP
jgi:hypothetical protein